MMMVVPLFLANFPEGLLCPMPRRPLMVRAALLRRSCDGVAADSQTSSVALILRVASATELMLLRRSWGCAQRCCDGAATESLLRRSRCCDGTALTTPSALILRDASRRDALNEEPASFPPALIQISMWSWPSPRPPPWPRNIRCPILHIRYNVCH